MFENDRYATPPTEKSKEREIAKIKSEFLLEIMGHLVENAPEEEKPILELPSLVLRTADAVSSLLPAIEKYDGEAERRAYAVAACDILKRAYAEIENLKNS